MGWIAHGGRLDAAMARFGGGLSDWLDLSTGINPVAYPVPTIALEEWHRLPDEEALTACLAAARRAYGVGENGAIVAGPGTQALIQWLPRLVASGRALIVAPTYGEYAQSAVLAGHTVTMVDDLPAPGNLDGVSMVFVCRPNNPDGRIIGAGQLLDLAARLADQSGLLVVDEAFCDVTPGETLCGHGQPGMVVLRSFGKFFGLAGVRLGFAVGAPDTVGSLESMLGPWALSGPALRIGARALCDTAWIAQSRQRLAMDRVRLSTVLERHGFALVGGTDLFVLARHRDAQRVHDGLARTHVLTRPFDRDPTLLRFGLPTDAQDFARLDEALAKAV